jgi:hypothetical protein
MKEVEQIAAARPFVTARWGRVVRWTSAAMLAMIVVPSFAATPLELAHEVNTQIVTRQVLNEGQDFLRAFGSGEGISSPDDPPACREAIQTAMAVFLSAGIKRVADGIQDPAGQAAFDQVLIQSYTAAELKAFLAQRDEVALPQLSAAVLAAPKVRAAHDARMEVFTLGDPDPASPEGMGMQRAKETCDRLRSEAG